MSRLRWILLAAGWVMGWASTPVTSQAEEFRGAWVPSVFNLCYPSRAGLSVAEQKAEITHLLDVAVNLKLNAILFQVRPEADALYDSKLEPWSRFLTGRQGKSPGFDPLAFMIAQANPRGIGVHAWLNPFRAAATASKPVALGHISNRLRLVTYQIDGSLWLDPGSPAVQDEIVRVAVDLVERYDLAGIHLDDYFYPYPTHPPLPAVFPDQATYGAYIQAGGPMGLLDWRRDNVNRLIHRLSVSVKTAKPGVLFGVSPFGVYRPGRPTGVLANLDQYNMLASDPVKWMREGWVDYLAPQLYWPDHSDQSFSALLAWWRDPATNPRGIPIYPGIALERLDPPFNWPVGEIDRQILLTRRIQASNQTGTGFIFWQMSSLLRDTKSVSEHLAREMN